MRIAGSAPRVPRLCVAALLLTAACDEQVGVPRLLEPGDVRSVVTADVARSLGPDGKFPHPAVPDEVYPQISREGAEEIAVAWVRTFGKFFREEIEKGHGKRIDWAGLQLAPASYYAAGVYEPVERDALQAIRNAYGPHYMVYMVDREGPVLSLAVAAFTNATVDDGRLVLPFSSGMEVVPNAVPGGQGYSMPVTPEQAVVLASRATAARVASAPELIMPGKGYHPQHARWRVTLDSPVNVRRVSGGSNSTREVYVGLRGEITVPKMAQPERMESYDPALKRNIWLVPRAGRATEFERASFNHP